jgi:hypothetical protein
MPKYAAGTEVPLGRSRDELERLLIAHGATGFAYGHDDDLGVYQVMFRMADRAFRFTIPMPRLDDPDIWRTPTGRRRSSAQQQDALQAEARRRWRALLMITKARLVAIEDGVMTLEQAFLADIVLPNNQTVGEYVTPQLDVAYATHQMPAILPGSSPRELESGR